MPKTVAEQIADRLRSEILTGVIRPGARLFQDLEATRLDVSRTPLREAFRQLEAERLIEVVPNRGAIVTQLRTEEVREVFLIRGQLEPLAAANAARLATPEQIEAIGAVFDQLEGARTQSGTKPLVELNKEFHFKVYEASALPRLVAIIASLWGPIEAMRAAYASEPFTARHAAGEHARLYAAIRDHDEDAAAAITRQHVESMAAALLGWMEGTAAPEVPIPDATADPAAPDGHGPAGSADQPDAAAGVEPAGEAARDGRSGRTVRDRIIGGHPLGGPVWSRERGE